MKIKYFVVILIIFQLSCGSAAKKLQTDTMPPVAEIPQKAEIPMVQTEEVQPPAPKKAVKVGAERLEVYLPLLKGKTVALLVNHTSTVGKTHLVDTLQRLNIRIKAIFAPEHGFRGTASDGEKIEDAKDPDTGIPLISLYGNKRAPSAQDLAGVDWLLFDIQDVGTRFYTYISTMAYAMQACADNNVKCMILDRPNPNGHFVDGPMLAPEFKSFVGLHPVPVVYGMTIGEYAQMTNGENWLAGNKSCDLTIITCENYDHTTIYELPNRPSPNLPNMRAIYLYPSICFFEGTNVSVGRGTNKQFQVLGAPNYTKGDFTFMPQPMEGAMQPPLQGQLCRGYDLTHLDPQLIRAESRINLSYLLDFYANYPNKEAFFLKTNYIDKLAGSKKLRDQIIAGKSEADIRASWQEELTAFKLVRKKYLLYKDFE